MASLLPLATDLDEAAPAIIRSVPQPRDVDVDAGRAPPPIPQSALT